ncbi:hypothetical protein ES708_20213 [subsurface metagenome]
MNSIKKLWGWYPAGNKWIKIKVDPTGKILLSGISPKPKKYYYTEGVENVSWVVGYSEGGGSQSKESDHLYIYAARINDEFCYRTYVTDLAINMTSIDTLYFDFETIGVVHLIELGMGGVKMDKGFTTSYRITTDSKARGVVSLDVSAYSGNYYIKLQAYTWSPTYPSSKANIYNVYAEFT